MRYELVTEDVIETMKHCIENFLPELANPGILCVFDNKLKVSKGKTVLAYIKKANEVEKFLSLDDDTFEEGPDYFIFINKKAWEIADGPDRIRLMRHELRHADIDLDHEKNPYKVKPHDLEDFYDEVALNVDKPRWAEELAMRTKVAYENEGEPAPANEEEE